LFEREAQARVPMNSRAKPRAPESAPPPIPVQNPKLGRPNGVWDTLPPTDSNITPLWRWSSTP